MNVCEEVIPYGQLPVFIKETEKLKSYLAGLSYEQVKNIWRCNDKIAGLNYERLQQMNLRERLTPAVLAYEGLQYQHLAPHIFSEKQWRYVSEHLVILSGFYGMLRATDGITPYRLEMQALIEMKGETMITDLYQFWGDALYRKLTKSDDFILNLASKEYSKVIEKHLDSEIRFVSCVFGEETEVKGKKKVKVKGTLAKMARGEMVRYLAEQGIQEPEGIKAFSALNYRYSEEYSDDKNYVFLC